MTGQDYKVYNFRFIEIVSETEIKEHFNFDHPLQHTHEFFINSNIDRVIEILSFKKTYLYEIADRNMPK